MLVKLLLILLNFITFVNSSCECLKCTEKGVQAGLCGCTGVNECGYEDKMGLRVLFVNNVGIKVSVVM